MAFTILFIHRAKREGWMDDLPGLKKGGRGGGEALAKKQGYLLQGGKKRRNSQHDTMEV